MVSAKKNILARAVLAVALSPVLAVGALTLCMFVGMVGGVHIALPHLIAASFFIVILVAVLNWKCWEGIRAAKSSYIGTYILSLGAAFAVSMAVWQVMK